VTLPEILVVLSIVALAVAIAVPVVGDAIRSARIRVAADHLVVTFKAARMIAVSGQAPLDLVIYSDTENAYEYTDATGRLRRYEFPPGVRIVTPTTTVTFRANGSVGSNLTTRLEVDMDRGGKEVWTIETNLLGIARVTRSRVP